MSGFDDRWLWFIDDAPLQALLKAEAALPDVKKRAATSPAVVKAVGLHLEGRTRQAIGELEAAAAAADAPADVFAMLGQLRFEAGDYERAAGSFARCAELDGGVPTASFNAGACWLRLGRWPEAAAAFERALEAGGDRAEAALALGVARLHLKQPDQAAGAFEQCLAKEPANRTAIFGRAVALQMLHRWEEARELYAGICEAEPESPELLANLVALGMATRDADLTREAARKLERLRPKSRPALEGLASAAFAEDDHVQAALHLKRLVEAAPDCFEGWFNLGVAFHSRQDFEHAIQAYQRAAALKPDSEHVHAYLAFALEEKGDAEAARREYERALEIAPQLVDCCWNLALLVERAGETDRAMQLFEHLAKEHDREEAWFRLATGRMAREDYAGAARSLESCLRKRSQWPEAHFNLGVACARMGRWGESAASFERVLGLEPASADALRALASIALEQGNVQRALEYYHRLRPHGGAGRELAFNTAVLLQDAGKNAEAAEIYREALEREPQFTEALLNLGHALDALGKSEEARQVWDRAAATAQ